MKKLFVTTAAVAALTAPLLMGALSAQAPQTADAAPAFEVAAIKPNNSGDGRVMMMNQPGRFIATNITLRLLIRNAYQVQDFQISGGPGWLTSDHFDINAKLPDGLPPAPPGPPGSGPGRLQLMIRQLLADRFKLVMHNETKDSPIYALILARSDGKLGPEMKKSETDCAAAFGAARGRGGAMPPPGAGGPGGPGGPGGAGMMNCGIRIGPGNIAFGGSPLSQFANNLGNFTGRVVVDKTGLTGNYDFNLTWTPDQQGNRPPGAPDLPVDPNGPSIFTAVQEQLGLKLDAQRGPVEVMVIDRAEKPVEN